MYSVFAKKAGQTVTIYNDVYMDDTTLALDPKLELTESCAGTFKIKLPQSNNGYDFIERLNTEITVKKENNEIWSGRVISEETDFWKNRVIECEGELAYLNDTTQPQAEYHNITPLEFLRTLIGYHNQKAPSDKQFTVGAVTVTDPNDSLYRYTNYESTLEAINDKLVKRLGGYVRIRKDGSTRYIDYLEGHPDTNSQEIEFGTNLLDFTKTFDSTDFCTVVLPLGERQDESTIEALEQYLTVESVNSGSPYVVNQSAYEQFGWIAKVVHWDDVTQPSVLLSKARAYLTEVQFDTMVLEVEAVDLHYTDKEIEAIGLSSYVKVKSKPHGLDRYFPVTKLSIPLNDPASTTFTLGSDVKVSLTARANEGNSEIQNRIEQLPTENHILNLAKNNANQIINSATTGYFTVTQKDNGSNEVYFTDKKISSGYDPDNPAAEATRYWRWNLNGLGYYNKDNEKFADSSDLKLALTMDGAIVADFITTGILNANIIQAGILKNAGWGNDKYNAVAITFSADSETENNYDYIYIYYFNSVNNIYKVTDKIMGNIGGRTIRVPSGRFYIYWYTDSSVTRNGWKIESVVPVTISEENKDNDFPNTAYSPPSYNSENILNGIDTLPESSHPYGNSERILWDWDTKLLGKSIFYLDLDKGILKMAATSLSISGSPAATQGDIANATDSLSQYTRDYADLAQETAISTSQQYTTNAISNFSTNLNQKEVLRRLTNGYVNEGLYVDNEHLYINASYIKTGTIDATNVEVSSGTSSGSKLVLTAGKIEGYLNNYSYGTIQIGSGTFTRTYGKKDKEQIVNWGGGYFNFGSYDLYLRGTKLILDFTKPIVARDSSGYYRSGASGGSEFVTNVTLNNAGDYVYEVEANYESTVVDIGDGWVSRADRVSGVWGNRRNISISQTKRSLSFANGITWEVSDENYY